MSDKIALPTKKADITDTTTLAEDQIEDMSVSSEPEAPQGIIEFETEIDIKEEASDIFFKWQEWLTPEFLLQMGIILIALTITYIIATALRIRFRSYVASLNLKEARKIGYTMINGVPKMIFPFISVIALFICVLITSALEFEHHLIMISVSLLLAKLIAIFATSFINSKAIARWVSMIIWGIAALHIMGWYETTVDLLSGVNFSLGQGKVSLFTIIKGSFYFMIFLWAAKILSGALEKKIKSIEELTPSLKVLFSKILKSILIFFAILFGLDSVGVDLSSFAIFGGAIGVGIGFGLQKVVSNFISGIILLLDRSIKPGDVIAVNIDGISTFGWVNTLGARYVSIIRRDGKEHLIPNELLITEKVENWSFSNNDIRLSINIGVSYNSDLRKVLNLCLEAAEEEPRVKAFPEPVVRVIGFGDSSVDIEIRGWINDPVNGIGNIRSDVLLSVWDKFQENNIEIPFPQRDLNIKSISDEVLKMINKEK